MDSGPPKIYDIQLVINSIDFGGTPAKVLCLECCGSRMFVGTAEGFLVEYFIVEDKSKTYFNKVRQANLNKSQPVIQIRNASAFDSLLVLSGGSLSLYDSQSLEMKGSNCITGVNCFAVDENPVEGDPFVVPLCFARRKSVVIAQASEKGFSPVKEISLDAMAVSVAVESGLICAALSSGRYVFVNSLAQRKSVQDLCEFDPKEVQPKVVHVGKEEFLVIGPGGLGVFTTSLGTSERPPVIWPDRVNQLVVDGLNVVASGTDSIFVSSLSDPGSSSVISFPGVKCLGLSEGKLYVGTARSLYRFIPISVDDQVEALISSDKIEQAFSLLEMSQLKPDKKEFLFRRIHRKAVFLRMTELDLQNCKESITLSNIDLREIISLFPTILPNSTIFTRSLPQLHDFIDVNQMTRNDRHKTQTLASFTLDVLTNYEPMTESKDLSTSAIKLAARYDKSKFIVILDSVNSMNVEYEDCFEWMTEHKMYDCAALLYKAKGDLRRALEVWLNLLNGTLKCGDHDEFEGIDVVIDTLLSSNDEQLVWEYHNHVSTIDCNKALEIFTKRDPSIAFQPLEIAEKLASNRGVCISYLQHCVDVKQLNDEDLHTFLATLYIDQIGEAADDQIDSLRQQFRQFLIASNSLKVQFLIGKINKTNLKLELAILHGKAGDHAPALKIIVDDLQDHQFAREYCKKIQEKTQRKQAFIDLFQTYLSRSAKEDNTQCIEVLVDFVEEFDASSVLHMLPDDWSMAAISKALHRALRLKLHQSRKCTIVKGLSERVHTLYQVEVDAKNQGYQVDEDSVCGICWRKFDSVEPLFHNKGLVVHSKCI